MTKVASKTKPSYIYSSISVAIVMFLVGGFVLLLLHAQNLTNIISEKMNIVVELDDKSTKDNVTAAIYSFDGVKENSVQFISKEEAMKQMASNQLFDASREDNPFLDIITFNINAKDHSESLLESIKTKLVDVAGVQSVYYEDITIGQIKENLRKVAYTIFCIGLIFVFLAIIIIRNTVNLSMYADRWEIKTMELVGAKWRFIKMPYIKSGVIVGFNAFLIASIFILLLLAFFYFYLPFLWDVVNWVYVLIALAVIFVLSISIPALTSHAATNRYLKKNMDALYD